MLIHPPRLLLKHEKFFSNSKLSHETIAVNHAPLIDDLVMLDPEDRDSLNLRLPVRGHETDKGSVVRAPYQKARHHPVIFSNHIFDIDVKVAKPTSRVFNHRFESVDPIRQMRFEWEMIDERSIDKLINQIDPAAIPALFDIPPNHRCRTDSNHPVSPRQGSINR